MSMRNRKILIDPNYCYLPSNTVGKEYNNLGKVNMAKNCSITTVTKDNCNASECPDPKRRNKPKIKIKKYKEKPKIPNIVCSELGTFLDTIEIAKNTKINANSSDNKYRKNRARREPLNPQIFKVKDVDWSSQKQKRAGVIVYKIDENKEIEICLGKDTVHGSLTDFGGGVKNSDLTVIHAALREFYEETYGAFKYESLDPSSDPKIQNSIVVFTDDIIVLFLELDYFKDSINLEYQEGLSNARKKETNGLFFLNKDGFCEGIQGGEPWIFFPIRDFLKICVDDLFVELKK